MRPRKKTVFTTLTLLAVSCGCGCGVKTDLISHEAWEASEKKAEQTAPKPAVRSKPEESRAPQ